MTDRNKFLLKIEDIPNLFKETNSDDELEKLMAGQLV